MSESFPSHTPRFPDEVSFGWREAEILKLTASANDAIGELYGWPYRRSYEVSLSDAWTIYRDTTHAECLMIQGSKGDAAVISKSSLFLIMLTNVLIVPLSV